MILKNSKEKVRLIWQLLILVVPFLLAAYLLRYVPIRIQTGILIEQGLSKSAALAQARNLFLEDPIGSSSVGIVQGLLWYVIVGFLIRIVNRRSCDLQSFGLSLRGRRILLVPLGLVLGLIIYVGYFWVGGDSKIVTWVYCN